MAAPVWSDARLEADRTKAIAEFRDERLTEPLEAYLEVFESYRDAFDELLETTVDLTQLADNAVEVLTDARFLEAVRYLAAPPMSSDDLTTLAEAPSLSAKVIKADPELAQRIIATVLDGLDRRRFPWFTEGREATEQERASAVLAVAAPAPRGADPSTAAPRDTWRVVADDGRTYTATVHEPVARSDYHHARMTVGSRTAEKRATTARRAVCLAALDLGLGVVEIRAPGELTKDEAVEAFSRVACDAIEGA